MLTSLLYAALLSAAPVSSSSQESPSTPPAVEHKPVSSLRAKAPIIAGIGATLAVSGTALAIVGGLQDHTTPVQTTQRSLSELPQEARLARQTMLGGAALALVGVCAVGVSAVMWNWAPERPRAVSASVVVSPHGGILSLTGKFP